MINGSRIAQSDTLSAKEAKDAFCDFISETLKQDAHIRGRSETFEISRPAPGIVAVRLKPLTRAGASRFFEIKVSEKV